MNNFRMGSIVSLSPATQALLAEITGLPTLPAVMTAHGLHAALQRCRRIGSSLQQIDREILGELLADLDHLAEDPYSSSEQESSPEAPVTSFMPT